MKNRVERPDSLIFDMDGTLWDNVNTYVIAWNLAFKKLGHVTEVTRESLMDQMGKSPRQILDALIPEVPVKQQDLLFDEVIEQYKLLVPTMTPIIYTGVLEGLEKLYEKYKLLLLSNCEEGGLVNLMRHTKTTHLFMDYMEFGQNNQPKSYNLKLLKERNNLSSPVYIGDTEGDSKEAALAGVPFVFMTYGFGETANFQLKFDTFGELTDYYMNL